MQTDLLIVLLSSSPTDGGHTFSAVNHTQQTQFEFDSLPLPDKTSDGMLQHLIECIKAWKLSKDMLGTLLDKQEFPILEDQEEVSGCHRTRSTRTLEARKVSPGITPYGQG